MKKDLPTVGASIHGYTVKRREPLNNLQGEYLELEHQRTGARHIHVACPDDNNLFCVTFPTIPQDSTGVAHILEHIVLCGSEKYPVRDPFFSMMPRSLSTFMNAFTSSAWTAYPFSTRNTKDFENLLAVYLDATFFPKLTENSFLQEGWRFEFADGSDPSTPLEFKGVVFNEMKGAMASVPSIMFRFLMKSMLPDTTYANNSGGAPEAIPDLTWQALREFHARHYHPSNGYFFTYGNQPLAQTLETIGAAINRFDRLEVDASIPDQARFTAPRRVETVYPAQPGEVEKKSQVLVSWLTGHSSDSFEVLCLRVLEAVLLSNAASPLRKALIESGLGSALADATGLIDTHEALFSAGLKDVHAADVERIETLIVDTLRHLAEQGVPNDLVDAAIHRLELSAREISNSGEPYALKVWGELIGAYLNGGDPYRALQFDADTARLATERARGPFFEGLIRKYFLENPHRVTITLNPDPGLQARLDGAEQARLEAVRANLTDPEVARIVADAQALKAEQETPQDLSVLPTLALSDVPMRFEDVAHRLESVRGATLGLFPQPTNGLVYASFSMDFSNLPDRLKDLVPVFTFTAPKMGAGASDYLEMAARIEASTGGIGAGAAVRTAPDDLERWREAVSWGGKALERNVAALLGILRDQFTALRFDAKHLRNLLGQYRAALEARIVPAGHTFSSRLAGAQLSSLGVLRERLEGITQLETVRGLTALDDEGLSRLIADLEAIRDQLFRTSNLRVCLTAEADALGTLEAGVGELLAAMPAEAAAQADHAQVSLKRQAVARSTAVPVAYDSQVVQTVPYSHPDAPALVVLAKYLRSRYLHPEIREKGGAYGGFATAPAEFGTFELLSYRDPHVARTFKVFHEAAQFVLEQPIDPEALKESILDACGDADPLLSPDSRGSTRFFGDLAGYTLPVKERFKRGLLAVTADDLRRVAKTYLNRNPAMAVIGSADKIEAANQEMGGVFAVSSI